MVTPPVGDMVVLNPDEVPELELVGDEGEPIRGAAKVAAAPISAANTGITTACIETPRARR